MEIEEQKTEDHPVSGPSQINKHSQDKYHVPDIIMKYKETTLQQKQIEQSKGIELGEGSTPTLEQQEIAVSKEIIETDTEKSTVSFSSQSREYLERRLKIEEEVTFVSPE